MPRIGATHSNTAIRPPNLVRNYIPNQDRHTSIRLPSCPVDHLDSLQALFNPHTSTALAAYCKSPYPHRSPPASPTTNSCSPSAVDTALEIWHHPSRTSDTLIWMPEAMSNLAAELRAGHEELLAKCKVLENPKILKQLESLEASANEVGKAWSQSWLGYQSRVYYAQLEPPPPGAHFSSEWGLIEYSRIAYSRGTTGHWQEFQEGVVEAEIRRRAGDPDLSEALRKSHEIRLFFDQKRGDIVSILRVAKGKHEDQFLEKLIEEAEKVEALTEAVFVECLRPQGGGMSRDTIAITQGRWTPPHISILAEIVDIKAPKLACESLANIARRAFSHLERTERNQANAARIGTNVFIGHGRSKEWMDLRDLIRDRMRLPWDEFNRVPVAGIPNAVRLSTMLDAAAIAFLVFTGEDEKADGSFQARMNVIHEAGLFQGRLGFARAIVMLEEGCQEFSNIAGLGQIQFPKNNIKAAFHDVQLVLEREGLIEPPQS